MGNPSTIQTSAADVDLERIRLVGERLCQALAALVDVLSSDAESTSLTARRLGMSRVIFSRVVNAVAGADAIKALHRLPGPESLRKLTQGAAATGVDGRLIRDAEVAIGEFARLIRSDFGTRSALNAAIGPEQPDLRRRSEHASRYQVHKGMAEILGVEAETWITSMIFSPSASDPEGVEITNVHGALGVRRLRRDVNVHFTFGPPNHALGVAGGIARSTLRLDDCYTNEPAPLESFFSGGQLIHRLAHDRIGRSAIVDMLAAAHNPSGSRRYATPERRYGGVTIFPDVPVKAIVADALLHDSIFPAAEPELMVFNPGGRGPANPNDPSRQIDRVVAPERIELLGKRTGRFELPETPHYRRLMERLFAEIGRNPEEYRLFRLRMLYPVHGFQIVMAFPAPPRPV